MASLFIVIVSFCSAGIQCRLISVFI